jgi:Leucine-rich repeat (LRR) protein
MSNKNGGTILPKHRRQVLGNKTINIPVEPDLLSQKALVDIGPNKISSTPGSENGPDYSSSLQNPEGIPKRVKQTDRKKVLNALHKNFATEVPQSQAASVFEAPKAKASTRTLKELRESQLQIPQNTSLLTNSNPQDEIATVLLFSPPKQLKPTNKKPAKAIAPAHVEKSPPTDQAELIAKIQNKEGFREFMERAKAAKCSEAAQEPAPLLVNVISKSTAQTLRNGLLNLSNRELTEIPAELLGNEMLTGCDLSHNQIASLPHLLWGMTGLRSLNLSHNNLTHIPNEIGNLPLQKLIISHNSIKSFNFDGSSLQEELLHLNCDNNQLQAISLTAFLKLETLSMNQNQLYDIIEFGENNQIQYLSAANNELTTLPTSIGNCRRLKTLDLSGNKLKSIPETLGNLKALQSISLRQNRLECFPVPIGHLAALQTLNLSRNLLTDIKISPSPRLEKLYLSENKITSLSCFESLPSLDLLDISSNKLEELPESLSRCIKLSCLDVRDNSLVSLSPCLGNLNLKKLYVTGNPFGGMPMLNHVSEQGTSAILSALRERFDGNSIKQPKIGLPEAVVQAGSFPGSSKAPACPVQPQSRVTRSLPGPLRKSALPRTPPAIIKVVEETRSLDSSMAAQSVEIVCRAPSIVHTLVSEPISNLDYKEVKAADMEGPVAAPGPAVELLAPQILSVIAKAGQSKILEINGASWTSIPEQVLDQQLIYSH